MADYDNLSRLPKEVIPALKRKLEAEALKAEVEARAALAEAIQDEVAQRAAERQEQEELASNKYNFVYAFNNPVNSSSVGECIEQLNIWSRNNPECDIEIIFNSPGGSVIDGMALFDFVQTLRRRGHKVTTGTLGMAASMAGILLQAGDVRYIGKESYVLIHEISTGAVGKIGEIEDVVEFVHKMQKRVLNIFASRSKRSVKYFEKKWKRADWWLSSDDCMEIGIVDEIR